MTLQEPPINTASNIRNIEFPKLTKLTNTVRQFLQLIAPHQHDLDLRQAANGIR